MTETALSSPEDIAAMTERAREVIRLNIEALEARIPAPLLGVVPRLEHPTAANAARFIDLAGLPGWPSARTSAPQ